MSFPHYERYKDSGVEWLGEVPEHWSIRRMKTLFEIKIVFSRGLENHTRTRLAAFTDNSVFFDC